MKIGVIVGILLGLLISLVFYSLYKQFSYIIKAKKDGVRLSQYLNTDKHKIHKVLLHLRLYRKYIDSKGRLVVLIIFALLIVGGAVGLALFCDWLIENSEYGFLLTERM